MMFARSQDIEGGEKSHVSGRQDLLQSSVWNQYSWRWWREYAQEALGSDCMIAWTTVARSYRERRTGVELPMVRAEFSTGSFGLALFVSVALLMKSPHLPGTIFINTLFVLRSTPRGRWIIFQGSSCVPMALIRPLSRTIILSDSSMLDARWAMIILVVSGR